MWKALAETVQSPSVLMLGIQDHVDVGQGLNREISDLEAAIIELKTQEKNLIQLMARTGVDPELVEGEMTPITRQRRAHQNRIQQLRSILSNKRKFGKAVGVIKQHARALRANLEVADTEGKIRTLAAFDVKVTAVGLKFTLNLSVDSNQY